MDVYDSVHDQDHERTGSHGWVQWKGTDVCREKRIGYYTPEYPKLPVSLSPPAISLMLCPMCKRSATH